MPLDRRYGDYWAVSRRSTFEGQIEKAPTAIATLLIDKALNFGLSREGALAAERC